MPNRRDLLDAALITPPTIPTAYLVTAGGTDSAPRDLGGAYHVGSALFGVGGISS